MLYEFTATGPANHQCWRRVIPPNCAVRLGRAPQQGWAVPWDLRISREHADLILAKDRLRVRRLSTARNRIYVQGEPLEEFSISPGEDFRIGRTTFQMSVSAASPSDSHQSRDDVSSGSETDLKALARQPTRRRLMGILQELGAEDSANGGSVDESPSLPNLTGSSLERYELLETLHQGPASLIVKAWHTYLEDFSAIQFLRDAQQPFLAVCEQFRRKANWLRHWDHPNLMRVLDGGIVENRHFLVMEFFQGKPLGPATDAERIPPETCEVIGYVRQAAGALDYVHRRGVVHGRIQLADLLVNDRGRVKLTGWTRAHEIEDSGAKQDLLNPRCGPVVDSTVCADSGVVPASGVSADICQLGQTLAILLAGTCGTGITDDAGTDAAATPHGPAGGDRVLGCIPPKLKDVVARMTDPDPASRYRNMQEVIQALRDIC